MTIRTLLRMAALPALLLSAQACLAADEQACDAATLSALGRHLKVAHFVFDLNDFGTDPAGVIISAACKRMPDDQHLVLVAAAWEAHQEDSKRLAIGVVDTSAGTVVAARQEDIYEDASTQVNNGSLRLDTAPYELAPGVRAFGLDFFSDDRSCGEGSLGPTRTLYVREGRTLRPVLEGLYLSQSWYLRGNQPRCAGDPKEADTAINESYDVTIGLGAAGKGGWRDLMLTVTARRDDHKPSTHKPLHARVPYDGASYPLKAFDKAYDQWRK
jgi:hypothetical protein